MTSKLSNAGSSNRTALFQPPPQVNVTEKLLASVITLPPDARIVHATFTPTTGSFITHPDSIELARRSILAKNGSSGLLDSLLTSVEISEQSCIHVFSITSSQQEPDTRSKLTALQLEDLAGGADTFAPAQLFPCSDECLCGYATGGLISSACYLPPEKFRSIYCHFIQAVRCRLIDDIVTVSHNLPATRGRQVRRLKSGFLLSPPPTSTEWGAGWEYRTLYQPLVYCHLQIYLTPPRDDLCSRLEIHPLLWLTSYLPLALTLPLSPGTPITLLPYGIPAYYLTTYAGPMSGLTKQFQDSLAGMGVSGWEGPPPPCGSSRSEPRSSSSKTDKVESEGGQKNLRGPATPSFIIAWISVENRQGEEKGVTVIWPTWLCVSFDPSTPPHGRKPLDYIPELPVQLQPSPPPVVRSSPFIEDSRLGNVPTLPASTSLSGTPTTVALSPAFEVQTPRCSSASQTFPARQLHPVRPSLSSSPTSESIRAFRTLALSKAKDIQSIASEVGGYVDSVARERERERERIRREREGSGVVSSPKLSRATTTPATPTSMPSRNEQTHTSNSMAATTNNLPIPIGLAGPVQHVQQANEVFYPSPPQSNPPRPMSLDAKMEPEVMANKSAPTPTATTATPIQDENTFPPMPAPSVPPSSSSTSSSFDPFSGMESTWNQPTQTSENDFLGMGMDLGMDFGMGMSFGMNMDSMTSNGRGGGTYNRVNIDFEDAFTDDDFSFFDQPSRGPIIPSAAGTVSTPSITAHSGLTPAAGPAPLGVGLAHSFFGDLSLSGSGAPQQTPTPLHTVNWHEGFTPRFVDPADIPPGLTPSAGQSPESHSMPVTPDVQLAEQDPTLKRRSSRSFWYNLGSSVFDPIPFALSHRIADGKYAVGKFALPSPPDEEDRTSPLVFGNSLCSPPNGWKTRYTAVTDPRIGIVRKLIGVKRKPVSGLGERDGFRVSSKWAREYEDWGRTDGEGPDVDDAKSEAESEDEGNDDAESPVISRTSTPPPAYLPLGPSLLHTHFYHSQLLQVSTPLRPPGAVVAPTNISAVAVPVSVPTPVSPAAALGAACEKSKSLEAAASMLAREVVENCVWSEAWRANRVPPSCRQIDVPQSDVLAVNQLFSAVPSLSCPLEMRTLFQLGNSMEETSLRSLESPMISVGKGNVIVQMLPSALRFWEKLGLSPRAGKKDVTAFVLYEDVGEERQRLVGDWLDRISTLYTEKHLGVHIPGVCSSCPRDGLFPLRFDSSFRKSLAFLIANIPLPEHILVFYVITPVHIMTLASPLLRQVFSAIKKSLKTYSEAQIHFQFIPDQLIIGSLEDPAALHTDYDCLCFSLYNRILQPVDRLMSRKFSDHGPRVRNYFQEPVLTLARSTCKVQFTEARTLDVLDRHTFLHIGYEVSPCGKWILAACIDERGEAYDLGVWLTQTPGDAGTPSETGETVSELSPEKYVVSKVWEFSMQFACRADVEWRIVVSRLGGMSEVELDAWLAHVAKYEVSKLHVTIVCVDMRNLWEFIPSRAMSTIKRTRPTRNSSFTSAKNAASLYVDASAASYTIHPPIPIPISLLSSPPWSFPSAEPSSILEPVPDTLLSGMHNLSLLPRSTMIIVRVPVEGGISSRSMMHVHLMYTTCTVDEVDRDKAKGKQMQLHQAIIQNFHELSVLAQTRWRLGVNPILPFHLAAVEAMQMALDRDGDWGDSAVDL